MNIGVVGGGYVGLVSAACFAHVGNKVVCIDIDDEKVRNLNNGVIPIYEPGLEEIIARNLKNGRLAFTTNMQTATTHADIVFICVGTPQREDGKADLSYVLDAAKSIGSHVTKKITVITKSTVPVGTGNLVQRTVIKAASNAGRSIDIDVVSNPEFLREGSAVGDFLHPDRVLIGADNQDALAKIVELYLPFIRDETKIISVGLTAAELTKYAANCFLANKISFMNEIANICDRVGANVDEVKKGIGSDLRIGHAFLNAGIGYGGSCFPKDVKAMIHTANQHDYDFKIVNAVDRVNTLQKNTLTKKIERYYEGDLQGKTFAVWGLAFKSQTDDMREASSLAVIDALLKNQCTLRVSDPAALLQAKKIWGDRLTYHEDMYAMLHDADALIILTEWDDFLRPDFDALKSALHKPVIFDGRNIYDIGYMKKREFNYISIGRPPVVQTSAAS